MCGEVANLAVLLMFLIINSAISHLGLYPKDTGVAKIQKYACMSFFCMPLFSDSENLIGNWLNGILISYP